MRVACVGHVEWIEFARVDHVPAPGEIVHALETWQEPGGGGAVSAVQLSKLAGGATFFTALGDDELGHRVHRELEALGLRVEVAWRDEPQRRGFVFVDAAGERTITVIGSRLGARADDPLPWGELAETDAVYFTAGDAGAMTAVRASKRVVATTRSLDSLREAGERIDALVASANDEGERYAPGDISPEPELVIRTAGAAGGEWARSDGETGGWDATPLPGAISDAYGCGDSFAGGVTFGLSAGMRVAEALRLGARCGAACFTGRGPYSAQLTEADL
ncbi:MAG: PfkB family carbohydrate kinase [Thermoleophilaceae bacterium]